jgi:hypothetical protein
MEQEAAVVTLDELLHLARSADDLEIEAWITWRETCG